MPAVVDLLVLEDIKRSKQISNSFLKAFAKNINMKLKFLRTKTSSKTCMKFVKKKNMIIFGCILVMSYYILVNLEVNDNTSIQNAIARDRFKLLFSKWYFHDPNKPSI